MLWSKKSSRLITQDASLPGRGEAMSIDDRHFVSANPLKGPYPQKSEIIYFGMGCFWGAERIFWQLDGVFVTVVGYQGGFTPNPTYEEVCSGRTGHTEAVMVVYESKSLHLNALLKTFWEQHNPTQGMGQGNDIGTQYRSAIYTTTNEQALQVQASQADFAGALKARGLGTITTEISNAGSFYFAESYHQQYLAKNPGGYCGLNGTGVTCPAPVPNQ